MRNRKKKIKHLKVLVKNILENDPKARDSDNRLILDVIEKVVGQQIYYTPFASIINNANALGIPTFESITRCRRKIQKMYPELQSSDTVDRFRCENEMIMREVMKNDYSKSL